MKQTWPLSPVQVRRLALATLKHDEAERIVAIASALLLAVVLGTGHLVAFVPDSGAVLLLWGASWLLFLGAIHWRRHCLRRLVRCGGPVAREGGRNA